MKNNALKLLAKHGIPTEKIENNYVNRTAILKAGQEIRALRTLLGGISQSKLSEKTGIAQAEISKIESGLGKHGPTVGTMEKIGQSVGLSFNISFDEKKTSERENTLDDREHKMDDLDDFLKSKEEFLTKKELSIEKREVALKNREVALRNREATFRTELLRDTIHTEKEFY